MTTVPARWLKTTLGDLLASAAVFSDGDWVETKDQDPDGDVRLTQLADVGVGAWRDRSSRLMRMERANEMRCTFLAPNDVLVARMPEPLGRACLFPGDPRPCVTAVDVCIIRPDPNLTSPKWLMWALNSPQARSQVASLQSGTTRKRISRKNLASIAMPLAPRQEQERIVAAIEEQFSRIDAAEGSLRAARRKADALSEARIRAAAQGDPVPLGDLLVEPLVNGRSVPTATSGFPVLRLTALRDGWIDLAERKTGAWRRADAARVLVKRGDFFISRGNGSLALVGRGGLVEAEPDEVAFPDTMIRARVDEVRMDPRFLRLAWNGPSTRQQIERTARTTAGIYKVNQQDLARVVLPVPPLEIQREIVDDIERQVTVSDAVATAVDHALVRSDHLRRAVLAEAFWGRLVPQDPNDEPASELLARSAAARPATAKPRRREHT